MDVILSVMVLAALALVAGAVFLLRRGGARLQAWLMLVLAGVIVANVLLWPKSGGVDLAEHAAEGGPAN
jgi:hypothetical protein